MLHAYLDRGAREADNGLMCVSAVVFKDSPYKQFCRQWNRILRPWNARAFHATDFYGGANAFRRHTPERQRRYQDDSRTLPQVVASRMSLAVVVCFEEREFQSVAPQAWRERYGGVNGLAAQLTAGAIGHWANRRNYRGKIRYAIEAGDDGLEMRRSLQRQFDEYRELLHTRMAGPPRLLAKGKARGLEAADFVAWHWNKYYSESVATKRRTPRRDMLAFLGASDEDSIHAYLYTGKNLEDFLIHHGCSRTVAPTELG